MSTVRSTGRTDRASGGHGYTIGSPRPPADDIPPGDLDLPEGPTVEVLIAALRGADSPRGGGTDQEHIRMLSESGAELPPILLHLPTMRVIDGMHRVEAARLRGQHMIRARLFDGDAEAAFVLAVSANVRHGLPLPLADRKAAAARIVQAYSQWSDRAIAAKVGLAHKTVAAIRRRSSGGVPHPAARVGRDGRLRAVRPEQPAPAAPAPRQPPPEVRGPTEAEWRAMFQRLRTDPSVRYTEAGRVVLRLLEVHMAASGQWHHVADTVPEHCVDALMELAAKCAEDCKRFAGMLRQRRADHR